MAQTAALAIDPLAQTRERLRDAIARLQAEQQRLATLEAGQTRAHEQLRAAERKLADAQDALRHAERDEPARLAAQFIDGQTVDDPIADAKLIASAAQSEVSRLGRTEAALASEIERSQATLRSHRVVQYELMAEIVTSSDEYRLLVEQHRAAWKQLRSVKEALKVVSAALHGYLPQRYLDEVGRAEPLEERIGYSIDNALVSAWQDAMAALEHDSETDLPLFG
jgi:chromosome segregation ATPase